MIFLLILMRMQASCLKENWGQCDKFLVVVAELSLSIKVYLPKAIAKDLLLVTTTAQSHNLEDCPNLV